MKLNRITYIATLLLASIGGLNAPMASATVSRSKPKRNGRGKPGAYGRGLRNAITAKTKTNPALSDKNGAFTLVGREPRRMWLAGISAQRGY